MIIIVFVVVLLSCTTCIRKSRRGVGRFTPTKCARARALVRHDSAGRIYNNNRLYERKKDSNLGIYEQRLHPPHADSMNVYQKRPKFRDLKSYLVRFLSAHARTFDSYDCNHLMNMILSSHLSYLPTLLSISCSRLQYCLRKISVKSVLISK
jgi:hypothetical protein